MAVEYILRRNDAVYNMHHILKETRHFLSNFSKSLLFLLPVKFKLLATAPSKNLKLLPHGSCFNNVLNRALNEIRKITRSLILLISGRSSGLSVLGG